MSDLKSIHSLEEQRAQREVYASFIEKIAHEIRSTDKIPEAAIVQVFWKDGDITRAHSMEPHFNRLKAIGALDIIKTEVICEIIGEDAR
jgi:hypothetical protein